MKEEDYMKQKEVSSQWNRRIHYYGNHKQKIFPARVARCRSKAKRPRKCKEDQRAHCLKSLGVRGRTGRVARKETNRKPKNLQLKEATEAWSKEHPWGPRGKPPSCKEEFKRTEKRESCTVFAHEWKERLKGNKRPAGQVSQTDRGQPRKGSRGTLKLLKTSLLIGI